MMQVWVIFYIKKLILDKNHFFWGKNINSGDIPTNCICYRLILWQIDDMWTKNLHFWATAPAPTAPCRRNFFGTCLFDNDVQNKFQPILFCQSWIQVCNEQTDRHTFLTRNVGGWVCFLWIKTMDQNAWLEALWWPISAKILIKLIGVNKGRHATFEIL